MCYKLCRSGGMADALDSGSSRGFSVWVQVPSSAVSNMGSGITSSRALSYCIKTFSIHSNKEYQFSFNRYSFLHCWFCHLLNLFFFRFLNFQFTLLVVCTSLFYLFFKLPIFEEQYKHEIK